MKDIMEISTEYEDPIEQVRNEAILRTAGMRVELQEAAVQAAVRIEEDHLRSIEALVELVMETRARRVEVE